MTVEPDFDLQTAHRHFSGACFNGVWDLLDRGDRTADEDEAMIRMALASHYHWTQREDYAPDKASVGHWQASRVYAILGQADNARRYAELCLAVSQKQGIGPFFLGYAYEALARAAATDGDDEAAAGYAAQARQVAEGIKDADSKTWLLDDLATI